MVIDVVNMGPQMKHQVETFGATSSEIESYNDRGIRQLSTADGEALRSIVDPYSYRQFLEHPKLIVLATNDENSPLDALNLYWEELIGPKWVLYLPNNTHEIKDFVRIGGAVGALHRHIAGQLTLPELKWQFEESAGGMSVRLQSSAEPTKVVLWTAISPTRDFRKASWSSRAATASADGFRQELSRPASGYAAAFAEVQFADKTLPYFLSTTVRIIEADGAASR
jgi:PhoPQ-activated pathogenicity-related protein